MESSINRVELLGRTGNRPTLRQTVSSVRRPSAIRYMLCGIWYIGVL
jgi:hypothetical protein